MVPGGVKIHGLLSWYDESTTWLSTAVTGFARFCDTIIAVDGAYGLYPGGKARSHPLEVEAIHMAAEAAGVGCLVYQPQTKWRGNEVEKRNALLDLAPAKDGDWLCVFDADFHVRECNPEILRAELERTELDVATYALFDRLDTGEAKADWTTQTRDLYRWDPYLRVGPTHASYSIGDRWLRGPNRDLEDALDITKQTLTVYHRSADRSRTRKQAAERYYQARETHAIEAIEEPVHG